ncbi:hypothetical protein [Bifidobacterium tissieri]|uniref:Uncharacterized protein n=1 Tax=Bifidobacterium tissieri TaxID=1630162 RepID=A0A5M9ZPA6_9BIFI|nr:hypothetical protein [Bifidobacterium tissieri]KAA8829350.1 hypothetical protein EM849_11130 [Bifidobacterium tissieri]KAA8831663.1 hypothetical protein EMO89_02770 [Bifidobacterium tissieri]
MAANKYVSLAGLSHYMNTSRGWIYQLLETTVPSPSEVFLLAHPVGSLYYTTKPDDPGSVYGGTWEQQSSLGPYVWLRTK